MPRSSESRQPSDIGAVKAFWESKPLFVGESRFVAGTREFFEEHRAVCITDCMAGRLDEKCFPTRSVEGPVLDLGCGPGFWLVELASRGFQPLVAADLTEAGLGLARRRCREYGVPVSTATQNAEQIGFKSGLFSHVNCQGVIHHTPDPQACLREIHRVLKADGTASISVYYRNWILRHWTRLLPFARICARVGMGLRGRGRESMLTSPSAEELVRRFDGSENPVGISFSRKQFEEMLSKYFQVEEVFFHFFPARALGVLIPGVLHRWLDGGMPFMIFGTVRKH